MIFSSKFSTQSLTERKRAANCAVLKMSLLLITGEGTIFFNRGGSRSKIKFYHVTWYVGFHSTPCNRAQIVREVSLLWHLSDISAICNFWSQFQILGGLTWPSDPAFLSPCLKSPVSGTPWTLCSAIVIKFTSNCSKFWENPRERSGILHICHINSVLKKPAV